MNAALATIWTLLRALNWSALIGLLSLFVGTGLHYTWPVAAIVVGTVLLVAEVIADLKR